MPGFGHPSSHPPSSHSLPHLGPFHYPHRAHTHQKSRAQFSRNRNPSYLHHVRSHLFSSQNSHGFSGAARGRGSISETTTLDVLLFSFVLKSLKSFFKTPESSPSPPNSSSNRYVKSKLLVNILFGDSVLCNKFLYPPF